MRQTPTRSRAMLAIPEAWRIPFSCGTPDTTMSKQTHTFLSHTVTMKVFVCLRLVSLTGVADGFHLVDVVDVDDVVKCRVEFVEEIHDLVRSAAAGELREAHDVTAHTRRVHRVLVKVQIPQCEHTSTKATDVSFL